METTAGQSLNREDCIKAVLERDIRFDGVFVLGVRTTGIYCRPSCRARSPKPENMRFFDDCAQAEEAGFRACKRCQPQQRQAELETAEQVCALLSQPGPPLSLAQLAEATGFSPGHLHRLFKAVMGITPRQYAEAVRLGNFTQRLKSGHDVAEAAQEAGYGSSSRVYERVPNQIGMTPARYKKGGRGMHINYTIVGSPLGRMLVGATERGVCAISFGDSDAELMAGLKREYPNAQITQTGEGLHNHIQQMLRHLSGEMPHLDLPLDLQVTAFQWRVMQALQAIPYGQTRSYAELAEAAGVPNGARAVAGVCAANPVAVAIPCHRIIHKDGSMSGYRWGVARKRALLQREAAAIATPA